ncbi:MAG: 7-carboxy-7-deazaguanine synthase QueE [Candidatus Firestonebacteria bacterium]
MNKKGFLDEIFVSYQGEGVLAGVRQVFIRFSLCNLKCTYCDTAAAGESKASFTAFWKKSIKNPVNAEEVLKLLKSFRGRIHSVSLTGGEPLVQGDFAVELAKGLKSAGFRVYLETNGTLVVPLKKILPYTDLVAMDIKLPSSSGQKGLWEKHTKFLKTAAKKVFVKIVVSGKTRLPELRQAVKMAKKSIVVLQPEYKSDIKKVLNLIEKSGVFSTGVDIRIIPQIHRFIGIK